MKKVKFTWCERFNNNTEEIIEFEDNVTEGKIQEEFERWLFELIGDRAGWDYIEE